MLVFFSEEDYDPELAEQAYNVAKQAGINVLSDKDLTAGFLNGQDLIGALFTGVTGGTYSFDVAVLPTFQGQGVGSQLTNLGIQLYEEQYADAGIALELDAVNPRMVEMLKRRGFEVQNQGGGHTVMKRATRRARLAKELVVYQDGLPFEEDVSPSLAPFVIEEKEEPSPHVKWMNPHHQNENILVNAGRIKRLAGYILASTTVGQDPTKS